MIKGDDTKSIKETIIINNGITGRTIATITINRIKLKC